MCDKVISENDRTLESVLGCFKNNKMCGKAVIITVMHKNLSLIAMWLKKCMIKLSVIIFQKCNLFLNATRLKKCVIKPLIDVFVTDSIPDQYKTQEICDKVVSVDPFMRVHCPDKYKTQIICDRAVDNCLVALKFILDWFVTSKMLEIFGKALHAKSDILFYSEDFDKITFISNQRHILPVYFHKIDLVKDNNFNEDDTTIHVRLLSWRSKFEKQKALKKR